MKRKTKPNDIFLGNTIVELREDIDRDGLTEVGMLGLTKREYFAAMAMQGLLSAVYSSKEMLNDFTKDGVCYVTGRKAIGESAVSYADALIEELNKEAK